ncbi:pro-sigmaK processing inhibitor BofA family protein [Paenibacillus sp. GCM10023252]|uniref:pro-sigmaK processing inhibitor BofA family protein n=1 Tax=Paenibacillus sp. GCM10023252 TaxID=3252649 RepID=UPI003622945B
MRAVWMAILIGSSLLLLGVLLRNKISWGWMKRFSLHLIAAAIVLYLLNFSGVLPGLYIPLNPVTISTVVVLGLPGVALLAGLQWFVI